MDDRYPLVSCVMPTYRRFSCVERSIACFLAQDYPNRELIIYNTDIEHPLQLGFKTDCIRVFNSNLDDETGHPYINTGAIRRDALKHARGRLFISWDDDDIFFPWNIRQCYDGIREHRVKAWKPYYSFMKQRGTAPVLSFNYMEASVLVDLQEVHEYGFKAAAGPEHLNWFDGLSKRNQLLADVTAIPGYCFYWADPIEIAGHKQSDTSTFYNPSNFEIHKQRTTDSANGRVLQQRALYEFLELLDFIPALLALRETYSYRFKQYVAAYLPFQR